MTPRIEPMTWSQVQRWLRPADMSAWPRTPIRPGDIVPGLQVTMYHESPVIGMVAWVTIDSVGILWPTDPDEGYL